MCCVVHRCPYFSGGVFWSVNLFVNENFCILCSVQQPTQLFKVVIVPRDEQQELLEDERHAALVAEDNRLRLRIEMLKRASLLYVCALLSFLCFCLSLDFINNAIYMTLQHSAALLMLPTGLWMRFVPKFVVC